MSIIGRVSELCNCEVLILCCCMYIPMSVTLGPWGVPSDVIRKRRTRVTWLHGLRACRMVTWFALVRVSRGYMVCLALALALPRVAGSASFNAVAFLV